MIVFHGSRHEIDAPDYNELTHHSSTASFPLGLWTSPRREDAARHGEHVYELELDTCPVLLKDDAILSRPRHIHIRDGRDVVMTSNRESVLVINFDTIMSFRYASSIQDSKRSKLACIS